MSVNLNAAGFNAGFDGSDRRSALLNAVQRNDERAVKVILADKALSQQILNLSHARTGWTPLFTACAYGYLQIARLLLEAGAERGLCDVYESTEKEHAVFKGHMKLAHLLSEYEARDHRALTSSAILRRGIVRPGDSLKCGLTGQTKTMTRLMWSTWTPNGHCRKTNVSEIFITLGPSNTRSNLRHVELAERLFDQFGYDVNARHKFTPTLTITAEDKKISSTYCIKTAITGKLTNRPMQFATEESDDVTLIFRISHDASTSDGNTPAIDIGTGVAVLKTLRQELGSHQESLIRDHTVPILENGSMTYIGSVTFNLLVVTPFQPPYPPPKASPGFWKNDGVGAHQGSETAIPRNLEIREQTVESSLTAAILGTSCVKYGVELTRDHIPVVSRDFLLMETVLKAPLRTLTFDEVIHLGRSQASKGDPWSSAGKKPLEKDDINKRYRQRRDRDTATQSTTRKLHPLTQTVVESMEKEEVAEDGPHLHPINLYDNSRAQNLAELMEYTREGMRDRIKAHSNLEPSSALPSPALEQLLSRPDSLAVNIEIKYPMRWEAEDRGMDLCAIELNFFVDTILTTIFRLCGDRNITLSSFNPDICIMLACKQETFPILCMSKAGSVPTGDVRAGSMEDAVQFAKAWNLAGVVVLSDVFVMCPRLINLAKDMGLVVASYGPLNDELECAMVSFALSEEMKKKWAQAEFRCLQVQAEAGIDAIITSKTLISDTHAKVKS